MKPANIVYLPVFTLAMILSTSSSAQGDPLERCLEAAAGVRSGTFVKVESIEFEKKPVYEIEIRNGNGLEHELMCDAGSGKIIEIETEVRSPSDPKFNAKIDLKSAIGIAQERFSGKVEEIEYEIEEDGQPTYEIDLVDTQGREMKIEVDAISGKIIEESVEKWQIGEEPEESGS